MEPEQFTHHLVAGVSAMNGYIYLMNSDNCHNYGSCNS